MALDTVWEDNDQTGTCTLWANTCTNQTLIQQWTQNPIVTQDYRGRQRQTIPNFHKRKAKGELLPYTVWTQFEANGSSSGNFDATKCCTPCTKTMKLKHSPAENTNQKWLISYDEMLSWTGTHAVDGRSLIQQAAARIYTSGWDALTFAGEFRETVRMFKNLRQRFYDITKSRAIQARKLKTAIEDARLEVRYGYRPLANDMKQFAKALARLNDHRQRFRQTVGGPSFTESNSEVEVEVWSTGTSTTTTTTEMTMSTRAAVCADIEPPKFRTNFVITAYELTRLSFVLDWFVQVNTWLEAMSFLACATNYTAAWGYQTTFVRTQTASIAWASGWSGTYYRNGNSTATLTHRQPDHMSYVPTVTARIDIDKLMDLSSIIKKAFRR